MNGIVLSWLLRERLVGQGRYGEPFGLPTFPLPLK